VYTYFHLKLGFLSIGQDASGVDGVISASWCSAVPLCCSTHQQGRKSSSWRSVQKRQAYFVLSVGAGTLAETDESGLSSIFYISKYAQIVA